MQPMGFAAQPTDIAIGDVGAGFSAQANFYGPVKYSWHPILGADITPPEKKGHPPAWARDLPPRKTAATMAAAALFGSNNSGGSNSSRGGGDSGGGGNSGGSNDNSNNGDNGGDQDPSAGLLRRRRRILLSTEPADGDDGARGAGGNKDPLLDGNSNSDGDKKKGKKLILNLDDPLDLSGEFPTDYRNWAAVLSQVLLKKEGFGIGKKKSGAADASAASAGVVGVGDDDDDNSASSSPIPAARRAAVAALERLMLATHGHLAKAASGEEFFPRFHLRDPVFEAERGPSAEEAAAVGLGAPPLPPLLPGAGPEVALASSTTTKKKNKKVVPVTRLAADATFFNFSPCVISESATGR